MDTDPELERLMGGMSGGTNTFDSPEMKRVTGGAEMRAYNPTWRDRFAKWVLGDQPSYYNQRLARETIGSSGLGTEDANALDLTPLGGALHAQESLQHGDPAQAGAYAAASMIPGAFGATAGMRPAARGAISAMTGMAAGGATAFAGTEAQAADTFTPDQQNVINRAKDPAEKARLRDQYQKENTYRSEQEGIIKTLPATEQPLYRGMDKDSRVKYLERRAAEEQYNTQQNAVMSTLTEQEKSSYLPLNPQQREEFMRKREARMSDDTKAKEIAQTLPEADRGLFMSLDADGRKQYMNKRLNDAQKAAEENKARMDAVRPFAERYKDIMPYIPTAAVSLAMAIPYAKMARQAYQASNYIKGWETIASEAQTAIEQGDLAAAMPRIESLQAYMDEHQDKLAAFLKENKPGWIKKGMAAFTGEDLSRTSAMVPKGLGAVGTVGAGTIPFDMEFLMPNGIDAALLPSDSQAQKDALHRLEDPHAWGERLPTAVMQGAIPAFNIQKVPTFGKVMPPTARSIGQIKGYDRAANMMETTAGGIENDLQRAKFRGLGTTNDRNSYLDELVKRQKIEETGNALSQSDKATFLNLTSDQERAEFLKERGARLTAARSRTGTAAAAPTKKSPTVKSPGTTPKPPAPKKPRKPSNKTADAKEVLDALGIAT